jgi:ribonuclease BN (tRNA processing enzyme)
VAAAGLARLPSVAQAAPAVSRGRTKVVVLGSHGGQQINQLTGANVRCGTSVLIDVDGVLMVVDCGCGSAHRIAEAGYDMNAVRYVLVTHHHVDHVADLGSIATFAWSSGRNGADPHRRLDIYGPTGTKRYERGFKRMVGLSIADQEGPLGQRPSFDRFARWHEFEPPRRARRILSAKRFGVRAIRHIVDDHCDTTAVGRAATKAEVDTLVLYHLIPGTPAVTDAAWQAKVATHFGGRIVVARDLLLV